MRRCIERLFSSCRGGPDEGHSGPVVGGTIPSGFVRRTVRNVYQYRQWAPYAGMLNRPIGNDMDRPAFLKRKEGRFRFSPDVDFFSSRSSGSRILQSDCGYGL